MPLPVEKKFDAEHCWFQLAVEKPEIPARVIDSARSAGFFEKPEFHSSVIVTENARLILAALKEHPDRSWHEVVELAAKYSWEYALTDEYYRQEKAFGASESGEKSAPAHLRRSIIQLITLPDIVLFYESVRQLFRIEINTPVPHITLFAWSDYPPLMTQGIGISSEQELKDYSRGKV